MVGSNLDEVESQILTILGESPKPPKELIALVNQQCSTSDNDVRAALGRLADRGKIHFTREQQLGVSEEASGFVEA